MSLLITSGNEPQRYGVRVIIFLCVNVLVFSLNAYLPASFKIPQKIKLIYRREILGLIILS